VADHIRLHFRTTALSQFSSEAAIDGRTRNWPIALFETAAPAPTIAVLSADLQP
jgi:hypothetical protein